MSPFDQDAQEIGGEVALVNRKNGLLSVGQLVGRIDVVSLVIKRPHQDMQQFSVVVQHFIKQRGRANHLVLAPRSRLANAQEPDHIASIGMETQFFSGVGPPGAGIVVGVTGVADAEDLFAAGALRYRMANRFGQLQKRRAERFGRVTRYIQSPQVNPARPHFQ